MPKAKKKIRYLPRTFSNETLGTRGRVLLGPQFILSPDQVWRLERKLNPRRQEGFGCVGESPEAQVCPEDPGYYYFFHPNPSGGVRISFAAKPLGKAAKK